MLPRHNIAQSRYSNAKLDRNSPSPSALLSPIIPFAQDKDEMVNMLFKN